MNYRGDEVALDLINEWEARSYLHPAQKKAALQVAIRDALRAAEARALAAEGERDRLRDAIEGCVTVLEECANIMRPRLPSLADNVIGQQVRRARAALTPTGGAEK